MAGLGPVIRAFYNHRGCAFDSFPGGFIYVLLVITVIGAIVGTIQLVSDSHSIFTIIGFNIGVFLLSLGTLYQNYYFVEGCQAKKMLKSLGHRQRLKDIMNGKRDPVE